MIAGRQKITCPFCFESFAGDQASFRCVNPRCPKREEDKVYIQARGLATGPILGHVFAGPAQPWTARLFKTSPAASCDVCATDSSRRLCPHCHFELSHDAGLIDDRIIAIIGGRDTGKGHYIATLIHRLEQEVGAQFNFSLRMLGDDTRKRFEDDYRTPLFRNKTKLEPTVSAAVESSIKSPMVFRLTTQDGRRRRAINLSFFDAAGEDMISLDTLSSEARYICFADGIIFLLDSLQIETVRQQVPKDIPLPHIDPQAEPKYIVERLRELFERQFGLAPTSKIKTPVAFVLAKIDALLPLIEAGSALRMTGEHFGHFNLADAQSVHTEIWNYLQSWMGAGFSSRVEADFEHFHYFGVSSLGRSPDQKGRIETISPIRVEDPLLWLLYQLKFIKGQKGA